MEWNGICQIEEEVKIDLFLKQPFLLLKSNGFMGG
jgi:hypothetical protein